MSLTQHILQTFTSPNNSFSPYVQRALQIPGMQYMEPNVTSQLPYKFPVKSRTHNVITLTNKSNCHIVET